MIDALAASGLRWAVVIDDERYLCATRSAAREAARRLRRHPANANIRRFGGYTNADGVPRIVDTWARP